MFCNLGEIAAPNGAKSPVGGRCACGSLSHDDAASEVLPRRHCQRSYKACRESDASVVAGRRRVFI
jgi:hypothetical protein